MGYEIIEVRRSPPTGK